MSCTDKPIDVSSEDEADLKEWFLNFLLSVTAKPKIVVSHLDTPVIDTGPCGFCKA